VRAFAHRRWLNPGEANEIALRAGFTILQGDQHKQRANTEAERFKE
jgi:hypothetical protein